MQEMKIFGSRSLPPSGAIIVSNAIDLHDLPLIQRTFRRPIQFIVSTNQKHCRLPYIPEMRFEQLPLDVPSDVENTYVNQVLAGHGFWFLPLGRLARIPHLPALHPFCITLAKKAFKPIVPIWFDNPSTAHYDYFADKLGKPPRLFCKTDPAMCIGEPVSHDIATLYVLQQKLLELGAEIFSNRQDLQINLAVACIKGLKDRGSRTLITDAYLENKRLSANTVLGLSLALSTRIRKITPEKRLGIALPPGIPGLITNLAAILCGKTPVNLNFTAGRAVNKIAIRKSCVSTVISTQTIQERFKEFPWPCNTIDVQQLFKRISKLEILSHILTAKLLPVESLSRLYGFALQGGDSEAALLFSSGSTGGPKGIVLTHKNILANVIQVRETLQFATNKKLLGCLPIFHSFGFTVTIWYPICHGPELVTYINPLDAAKLVEIIHAHKVDLLVTTPTFLRGLMKRATPEQLSSLWGIVTGAEKLPVDLADQFEKKLRVPVREGYGLTETAPVVSVNLIDPPGGSQAFPGLFLCKRGTVGKPVPGVAVRITDPDTGQTLPSSQTGMIWLRGANVFPGYLDAPELTQEALVDGWFKTGDLGRLDEDGFLIIEGRVSRFSKIGGEMVPHGTIESILQKCFAPESEVPCFAVGGRPHAEKGEELVLLTTYKISPTEIGEVLRKNGLPNLWIPKVVKYIEKIPTLASGKLDLQTIQSLIG